MFDLEWNVRQWSDYLRSKGKLKDADIQELESHLRDEIEELVTTGLSSEESFIISLKRLGNVNAVSMEYSKINMTGFWKNLLTDADPIAASKNRKNIVLVILFSLFAGTLIKMPELFGYHLSDQGCELFYFKNIGLFVLPFITIYFLLMRKLPFKYALSTLGIFLLSAVLINVYPSFAPNNTEFLTALHLPIFLWLVVGIAYIGKGWKDSRGRMDFLRFTGESFIYGVLILCGVFALGAFLLTIFSTINIDLGNFFGEYLIIYGGCAAAMVAVYLVEAKKSIVENFAPILAKIFSPLFLISMLAFLIVMIGTGKSPYTERNFLIGFDLMLAVVLFLVLYAISARGAYDSPKVYDYINLALIVVALIIDCIALSAIVYRLSAFGITANKLAALGENLILMVNLGGLAIHYVRFFSKKIEFSILEKFQTTYFYAYAIWLAVVAFAFPLVFRFQ